MTTPANIPAPVRTTRRGLLRAGFVLACGTAVLGGCGPTTDNVCFVGATLEYQRDQAQDGLTKMVALLQGDPALAAANADLIDRANASNQALEDSKAGLVNTFDLLDCAGNSSTLIEGGGFSAVQEMLLEANEILGEGYTVATKAGIADAVTFPKKASWLETWWDFSSP